MEESNRDEGDDGTYPIFESAVTLTFIIATMVSVSFIFVRSRILDVIGLNEARHT